MRTTDSVLVLSLAVCLLRCISCSLFYSWSVCESSRLFLYDFWLKDGGCRIICLYLNSSNPDLDEYLDFSFTRDFELKDSEECRRSKQPQVCVQILNAVFSSGDQKVTAFNISFAGQSVIAHPPNNTNAVDDYKQEICFSTEDLTSAGDIQITPIFAPVATDKTRTHTVTVLSSDHTIEGDEDEDGAEEDRKPVPFSGSLNPRPMSGLPNNGSRKYVPRVGIPETLPPEIHATFDFKVPSPRGPPPLLPSPPPRPAMSPPVPSIEPLVIKTQTVLQSGGNGTVVKHNMTGSQMDILITFKQKKD